MICRKLILLDNNESDLHDLLIALEAKYPDLEIIPVLGSVTEHATLCGIFEQHQPQFVFHAAAYKHVPMLEKYPNEALKTNVAGTLNMVEVSHHYKVERFVLVSTG